MKKIITLAMTAMLFSITGHSQTTYDAARIGEKELNGTARFVAMGGALGALGADISAIANNPAAGGLLRNSHYILTLGSQINEQTYNGVSSNSNSLTFNQVGFISTLPMYSDKVNNFNIGFNVTKRVNLRNHLEVSGKMPNEMSQTMLMCQMMPPTMTEDEANSIVTYDGIGYSPYEHEDFSTLGVLGLRQQLLVLGENAATDGNGNELKANDGATLFPLGPSKGEGYYYRHNQRGGIYDTDVHFSVNLDNRIYIGANIGVPTVDYTYSSIYTEDILVENKREYYNLENNLTTKGFGLNLKLGVIWRPYEYKPFRVGMAIHTPTYYYLRDSHYAKMYSSLTKETEYTTASYAYGDEVVKDYKLLTPWVFNLSVGNIFFRRWAVGAEYEYTNYKSSKLMYDNGDRMEINDFMSENLKDVHTLRLGTEFIVNKHLFLRAGYNHSTAQMSKYGYKHMADNDMRTDTDFSNKFDRNTLTTGIGVRFRNVNLDFALKYDSYKQDFYPFQVNDYANGNGSRMVAQSVKTNRVNAMISFGVRY